MKSANIRQFLLALLAERCRKNPSYSLRAMARDLDTHPTSLSQLLSGKRRVSDQLLQQLARNAGADPALTQKMVQENRKASPTSAAEMSGFELEVFEAISEWYHFAILELTRLDDFVPDLKWIARTLSITQAEAQMATERLIRIGFLEIDLKGRWHDRSGDITTGAGVYTSIAHRRLQGQILDQAKAALEFVPVTKRDQSALTIAVRKKDIEAAREKITRFRRQMLKFFQSSQRGYDEVYQMTIALFPVTKERKKKRSFRHVH